MKDITSEFGSGKILPLVFKLTVPAVIAVVLHLWQVFSYKF